MTIPTELHPNHERNLQRSAAIDRANEEIAELTKRGISHNEARLIVKFRQLKKTGNGLRMMQIVLDGNSPPTFWRLQQDGTMLRE